MEIFGSLLMYFLLGAIVIALAFLLIKSAVKAGIREYKYEEAQKNKGVTETFELE